MPSEMRRSIIRGNDVLIRKMPNGEFLITINPNDEVVNSLYAPTLEEAEAKARQYCSKYPRVANQ